MKFRAAQIIYRAVSEGLIVGMQEARQMEVNSTDAAGVVDAITGAIMQKLHEVLVFDETSEQFLPLHHMAEQLTQKEVVPTNEN